MKDPASIETQPIPVYANGVLCENRIVTACLEPIGRRVEVVSGVTLLEAIQKAGIQIAAVCGGEGICGKCLVRLLDGELSPVLGLEESVLTKADLPDGFRLACRAQLMSDITVYIPPESLSTEQRLQTEGTESHLELDPVVELFQVKVDEPDIHDLRSDATRLLDACSAQGVEGLSLGLPVLRTLSTRLRELDWTAQIASDGREILGILPTKGIVAGLAVDIGTTKLAAYLVDLESGEIASKIGRVNPQVGYGDDVVNRIAYANKHSDGQETLQRRLTDSINQMIVDLCAAAKVSTDQILDAVVVGNTAMHHLFVGLPVRQLGEAPYVPAASDAIRMRSAESGLQMAPGAYTYLPPNVAGYVGADHIAMLLATRLRGGEETAIAIDIGTNTEVSLLTADRLLSCSCASGPAFEGAHIEFGMRAIPGAIERVEIHEGKVFTQTVDNERPVGICGSGILDAIAQMHQVGAMEDSGRLNQEYPGVSQGKKGGSFCLVAAEQSGNGRTISLSRKDVNEIQLAKAAIRTGIEILLQEAGLTVKDVKQFVIAGAFGTYLDVKSAKHIGMFPDLPLDRFHQIGNAAGIGAREMLVSRKARREAESIREEIEYVELTVHPSFFDVYTTALMF